MYATSLFIPLLLVSLWNSTYRATNAIWPLFRHFRWALGSAIVCMLLQIFNLLPVLLFPVHTCLHAWSWWLVSYSFCCILLTLITTAMVSCVVHSHSQPHLPAFQRALHGSWGLIFLGSCILYLRCSVYQHRRHIAHKNIKIHTLSKSHIEGYITFICASIAIFMTDWSMSNLASKFPKRSILLSCYCQC
jgi:hypothetical protein